MSYNRDTLSELYNLSNPIIKYRIDKEFRNLPINHEDYIDYDHKLINYWLNVYDGTQIHGANDKAFENAIGKLMDFGFDKNNRAFDTLFGKITDSIHWSEGMSFNEQLNKTVIYPFLIRAGYMDNPVVESFLMNRIDMIEHAISKYGYDLERAETDKPAIHKNAFVYKNDIATECLPTIYDLYAFAYYPEKNGLIGRRIEAIIAYILDERFMFLPERGYVYDYSNNRFYASGNVYHACLRQDRYIFYLYLLSFFETSKNSQLYMKKIKNLEMFRKDDGFYTFDKEMLKEKKNTYQLYTGGHMGLGENRRGKMALTIESTFWMLSILKNLE